MKEKEYEPFFTENNHKSTLELTVSCMYIKSFRENVSRRPLILSDYGFFMTTESKKKYLSFIVLFLLTLSEKALSLELIPITGI